jgi:hypothetical protein
MKRVVSCSDKLYYWVQHSESVSHDMKSFAYYHEISRAALRNFQLSLEHQITPARAFYQLYPRNLRLEKTQAKTHEEKALYESDLQQFRQLRTQLSLGQRWTCKRKQIARSVETFIYDRTVYKRG